MSETGQSPLPEDEGSAPGAGVDKITASLVLADHAEVYDGKISLLGGWWQHISSPANMGVVMIFTVPWTETNRKHEFTLELLTQDGAPVNVISPVGTQPLKVEGVFLAGRPPLWKRGFPLQIAQAINVQSLLLQPDTCYYWVAKVNGDECGRVSFFTRSAGG